MSIRHKILQRVGQRRIGHEGSVSSPVLARTDYMRFLLMHSSALIAPSEYAKGKYIEFGISPDLIHVIPLGMDMQRWIGASDHSHEADRLRFGYVGTLAPHKGCEVALCAFIKTQGAAEFVIYGTEPPSGAYTSRLRQLAGGDPRVHFMGPIPNEQLPQAFDKMGAFLMPTFFEETFSFVAREALLFGLPVIASNIGVMPEIIHDGVNGRLLPPGDVEAWAECLRDLIEHPERLKMLKPRRGDLVARSFEESAQDHLAVYYQISQAGCAG